MNNLHLIRESLKSKFGQDKNVPYFIPSLWVETDFRKTPTVLRVNPYEFFAKQIDHILESSSSPLVTAEGRDWSRRAVAYNLFVRLGTAFDHDQNGRLDLPGNLYGFRETGSFLKSIALLPYIKSLQVNTIHLLPITSIGQDGKKGNLGSPYAIRNPFRLDDNLCEPFLGLGAETEFAAFVEAAHHLGIRVVVEFVFRTASKDSDWAKEHPEWFYWIKDSIPSRINGNREPAHYGAPLFESWQLGEIANRVQCGNFDTIPPSDVHRSMFTHAPSQNQVQIEQERWVGSLPDGSRAKIAGAFADWPPDDPQPPWSDVTYLRMYDHPEFNYVAYNTVRMYDWKLAQNDFVNHSLWNTVLDIIPFYQRNYQIDGVMIDMGHALPYALLAKMVERAREYNPEFAFWEENFNLSHESKKQGYNASIGYVWVDEHHPHKLREIFKRYERETFPLPFFSTSESHNSPRSANRRGGLLYSRLSWTLNNFLPAIPFIHNGYELGETTPVNTGLDFSQEEIQHFSEDQLPLFSSSALRWCNPEPLCDFMIRIAKIRQSFEPLVTNADHQTFKFLECHNEHICAFKRRDAMHEVWVIGNFNFENPVHGVNLWAENKGCFEDLYLGGNILADHGHLKFDLAPGEFKILKPV